MIDGARITYTYEDQKSPEPLPNVEKGNYKKQIEFYLTDHLGNVRVVYAKNQEGEAEILQKNAYYPYGMLMNQASVGGISSGKGATSTNEFLYNGKESQPFTGYYAYGFRQLDPQLGRWFAVDKLAEWEYSTSPYDYVGRDL